KEQRHAPTAPVRDDHIPKFFGEVHSQTDIEYAYEGKNVVLLDFVYTNRAILEELGQHCKRCIILDHHQSTATQWMTAPVPGVEYIINQRQSACTLAWDYFMGRNARVPLLLRYIEDCDIARFTYYNSSYFQTGFRCKRADYEPPIFTPGQIDEQCLRAFADCVDRGDEFLNECIEAGSSGDVDELYYDVRQHVWRSRLRRLKLFPHLLARVVNCSSQALKGRVMGEMLEYRGRGSNRRPDGVEALEEGDEEELEPKADLAVIYFFDDTTRRYRVSLSTDREDVDVAEICTAYGGGGHQYVGGFYFTCHRPGSKRSLPPNDDPSCGYTVDEIFEPLDLDADEEASEAAADSPCAAEHWNLEATGRASMSLHMALRAGDVALIDGDTVQVLDCYVSEWARPLARDGRRPWALRPVEVELFSLAIKCWDSHLLQKRFAAFGPIVEPVRKEIAGMTAAASTSSACSPPPPKPLLHVVAALKSAERSPIDVPGDVTNGPGGKSCKIRWRKKELSVFFSRDTENVERLIELTRFRNEGHNYRTLLHFIGSQKGIFTIHSELGGTKIRLRDVTEVEEAHEHFSSIIPFSHLKKEDLEELKALLPDKEETEGCREVFAFLAAHPPPDFDQGMDWVAESHHKALPVVKLTNVKRLVDEWKAPHE
ncbi:hypothetical protein FOZ62_006090, partial [Perkinsus olseni]